ncbi:MAG: hypothetical protein Q3994_06565 [Prevotella sp.]|nr:hypothetical protein [Prevotella sp.]
MENLLSHIDEFYQSDKELTKRMEELAKVFLFRGYINVRNKYHIYLRTVEFYYHEEDGEIKDPIMYHRDNYHIEGKIPYFKPLSFNSHDTGVDITFENEKKHIRASVLIRAYEVLDVKSGEKMVWNPAAQQFQPYKEGLPKYNTQSMYMKKFLNGFASSGETDITWVSVEYKDVIGEKDITKKYRQGVFKSTSNDRYSCDKREADGRLWAFRREIEVEMIKNGQ